jgi:transposase InsO family protein
VTRAIADILPRLGEGHLTRLLSAASLSRATYYRLLGKIADESTPEDEALLRAEIHGVALDWPAYGYRRITRELSRRGMRVNHKRVLRLMREDDLLCRRKRPFVATTDSSHALKRYPNLAREMEVSRTDQLWVADITYVRLRREFVYLAVVLDAFSRRVVGWALERSLETGLPLKALQMALRSRRIDSARQAPSLVHHSDRGVQYASLAYTSLLAEHGIEISMSRRGCPYDNAQAESFMKTFKYEEVYVNEYESLPQARYSIGRFIERVYNEKRLHSALGYRPPAEFESMLLHSSTTP